MKDFPAYDTTKTSSEFKIQYLFESVGKEVIVKAIEYSVIDFRNGTAIFNLGFGDYDIESDSFFDDVNSNNGDIYSVFNTVLNTVPEFFSSFPKAVIMVGGSDGHESFHITCKQSCSKKCTDVCKNAKRRIKIYRYFVDKNFQALSNEYIFFGRNRLKENTFVEYVPDTEYDEILVYKKK